MFMNKYKDIRGLSEKNKWDYENGFYWHSPQSRIGKLISHYELYKSIINLPGDILEFGVYKASSLVRFATFRNMLENDFSTTNKISFPPKEVETGLFAWLAMSRINEQLLDYSNITGSKKPSTLGEIYFPR